LPFDRLLRNTRKSDAGRRDFSGDHCVTALFPEWLNGKARGPKRESASIEPEIE
jgi:hypothetical protein